ncbi:carboxypeptidase B-like [Amphiura filiformis]|uniref:carboxypeptidase B-like n=1 Tax=Amphiura filiformis TaxID=82378 RepID=UPI003B20C1CD
MRLICALFVFVASASAIKNYAGYQVLRVVPQDVEQLQGLHKLYNLLEDTVEFWKEPTKVNRPVDIMVDPNFVQDVKIELSRQGLDFSIFVEDVQTNINNDNERCTDCVNTKVGFDYNRYHTVDEISQWVTDFANENAMVTEISIGNSYEGRPIKAVKISSGGNKRVIYIQGGIHGKEWFSPATMIYMSNLLTTNYNTDAKVKAMVDNYDWYIVPSINVDGYAYTWTDVSIQIYKFSKGVGSNPCSNAYRGKAALSGTEISAVDTWIKQFSGNIALFIDFHNYSQRWMYPWSYTADRNTPQPDKDAQHALAIKATDALKVPYGTEYFVGMSGPDSAPGPGASVDYGYGTLGANYAYIVELRDQGRYGFLIPESLIEPSGIETFEALKVFGTDPLN